MPSAGKTHEEQPDIKSTVRLGQHYDPQGTFTFTSFVCQFLQSHTQLKNNASEQFRINGLVQGPNNRWGGGRTVA